MNHDTARVTTAQKNAIVNTQNACDTINSNFSPILSEYFFNFATFATPVMLMPPILLTDAAATDFLMHLAKMHLHEYASYLTYV